MNISSGQLIFAILFILVFIAGLIWAYVHDGRKNKAYFKGVYKIVVFIFCLLGILFVIVKLKN